MIAKYRRIEGFDGNFPFWLIAEELGHTNTNNRVRGVYAAATRLLGREADRSTPEEQAEAARRWALAGDELSELLGCERYNILVKS